VSAGSAALAIDGGAPVRSAMLPYGHQIIDDEDVAAVTAALRSDWLTTGPLVATFERDFARFVGARHAVAFANGTAALHGAAVAARIGPGDEVIVPALTFVASANCVRYVGGTVVFADVRPDTLTIDPDDVARRITARTRAIVAVDYAGQPCDLDELAGLARRHGASLMEDAAHAVGATYRGRPVGAIADLTTFSLHPVKQLTTGEGGVVTTASDAAAASLRRMRNHGIDADARQRAAAGTWAYDVVELGFNYRLTDVQSALGSAQLRRLPRWLDRRRAIAARYGAAFAELPEVVPLAVSPDRASSWHLYVVLLRTERLTVGREQVFRALRAENIGVNVHYVPVPHHTYYRALGYAPGDWPVAEDAYERMITLPLWAGMTDGDVDDVIAAVRKVVTAYRR
jgi:UDP-4-amino-4,6-dideoxy-N-acetyl-beta-L-altrosamine transaminase